jgi:DNA polymerase III sliding clamp (beta) subunit (PCNA family)
VALDGHKLAIIKTESSLNVFWPIDEIKKLKIFLKLHKGIQEFHYDVETKQLNGMFIDLNFNNKYPDYKRIIPGEFKSIEVRFNAQYLLDIVKSIGDGKCKGITLNIPLEGKLQPITCEVNGNFAVLMPMRK